MRISIALPRYFAEPIGGYHVHYTFANALAARGHDVSILFPRWLVDGSGLKNRLYTPVWGLRTRWRHGTAVPSFRLDPRVRVRFVPDLGDGALPPADILIATAWETAEILRHAGPDKGRKVHIVYDYEFWCTATPDVRARMEAAFNCGFVSIVTSDAVRGMVRACGAAPVALISCGLDFEAFQQCIPPEARDAFSVGFPARADVNKGSADAIAALTMLRERHGDRLRVSAFGHRRLPMPDWIEFVENPDQRTLADFHNGNAVFVMPSHFEGFGLPGAEAMACGAALVTTFNGGAADYAIPGETALVVPPRAPADLAGAIDRLLEDQALRIRLAHAGHAFVQRFQWRTAADALERVLLDLMAVNAR